jgi:SAM-dependent methyltransferase
MKILKIREINNELGNADLFLIDQILKGRFSKGIKILDCGCGEGRNMVYFIRNDFAIYGLDKDETSVRLARFISGTLNRNFPKTNIIHADLENTGLPDIFFDVIICLNVLHFSDSIKTFFYSFDEIYRMLVPGGRIIFSMESLAGENAYNEIGEGIYKDKDGASRFMFTPGLESAILKKYFLEPTDPPIDLIVDKERKFSYRFWKKAIK